MLLIAKIPVSPRAVAKIKHGFQASGRRIVHFGQQLTAVIVFGQQPFLDNLVHILACQRRARPESGLDFGKIIALPGVHVANHLFERLLGGDDNPGAPPAFGGQALGNGLQVKHELCILVDILADLIHKKIQAKAVLPHIQPLPHIFREILDGNFIILAELAQDIVFRILVLAGCPAIGLVDIAFLQ